MKASLSLIVGLFIAISSLSAKTFELVCPPDYYLSCGDDISNLSVFGEAYYWENNVKHSAGLSHVEYHLSSCNTGHITREWTVEDQYWNIYKCKQHIYISGGNFKASDITWPEDDLHLFGCDADVDPNSIPVEYQEPKWNYVTCSQVASSYTDQVFHFGQDCKKVLRHWTVIDWCSYKGGGTQGYFTHTQTIKISNDEPPLISCPKNIVVQATRCDSSYVSILDAAVEGESCSGSYIIKHNSIYADTIISPSGVYPIGKTKIRFSVEYACGSNINCETEIQVSEPGPVPYCLAELNVVLMGMDTDLDGAVDDGMVEVWAKDLDYGSYHPCNNQPLQISFSSDVTDMVRVFTCDDVGYNTVQMWVTDQKGNQSYCLVNVNVQNNAANIPDCVADVGARSIMSGTISSASEEVLENVIITAKDREPIYDYVTGVEEVIEYTIIDSFYNQGGLLIHIYDTDVVLDTVVIDSIRKINVHYFYTDENGQYATNAIPIGRDYEITAYKDGHMNEVNSTDLDLLSGHVYGRRTFANPYSYLAADVNEDKVVNIEDYNILKDLVNEEEDEWPHERQWLFYTTVGMEDMTNKPLLDDLSQMQMLTDITSHGNTVSFMGILKGDISKFEDEAAYDKMAEVDYRNSEEIEVFPNPFSEELLIKNKEESSLQIEIYNLNGKKVLSYNSSSHIIKVATVNELVAGTYMYRITKGGIEVQAGKLLKN